VLLQLRGWGDRSWSPRETPLIKLVEAGLDDT
jgi:hypothetical protein